MPMKLKVKERKIKDLVVSLEKPSKLIASSSGNGDAMIKPARRKVSHR